jgi:hypothetical protein
VLVQELIYYLLQLVQALRYERPDQDSPLLKFLIKRATTNFDIANYLYWYHLIWFDLIWFDFEKYQENFVTLNEGSCFRFLKVEAIPQESNDYHFIFRKFLLKLVNVSTQQQIIFLFVWQKISISDLFEHLKGWKSQRFLRAFRQTNKIFYTNFSSLYLSQKSQYGDSRKCTEFVIFSIHY